MQHNKFGKKTQIRLHTTWCLFMNNNQYAHAMFAHTDINIQ